MTFCGKARYNSQANGGSLPLLFCAAETGLLVGGGGATAALLTPLLVATRGTATADGCWFATQREAPIGACCVTVVRTVVDNDGAGQVEVIFDMVTFASIMLVWNILIAASPVDVDITPVSDSGVRAKTKIA
jgi:hypothetical protein